MRVDTPFDILLPQHRNGLQILEWNEIKIELTDQVQN